MKWMFETALKRAEEFNIKGVTYRLTQGVVKNIIPAIASTNAIIAAAEANEAFKIATYAANSLSNYMMYNAVAGIYTYSFVYEKKENCPVCGNASSTYEVSPEIRLDEFMELLAKDPKYQLKRPSIRAPGKSLYMQAPRQLEEATRPNLDKILKDLIIEGDILDITDPSLPNIALNVKVKWSSS